MRFRSQAALLLSQVARSRTARNLGWLGMATVAVKPIWFVYITLVCMRLLGAEGYGIFSSALAFAIVAASFSDLGTAELTTRNVARDRSQAAHYLSNLFPVRVVLSGVALILAISMGSVVSQHDSLSVLAAAGVYSVTYRALEFCRAFFRATEVHRLEALSMFLEKGLVIVLGTTALLLSPSPHLVTWAMALGMLLALTGTLAYIHRHIAHLRLSEVRLASALSMLRDGAPIGIFGVASLAILHTPTVLIESLEGAVTAGHYAAAFRVVEALQFLPAIMATVLLPRLSAMRVEGIGLRFRRTALMFVGSVVVATSLIAIFVFIVAEPLISILSGGEDFRQSAALLRIMIWGLPMMAGSLLVATSLLSLDDQVSLAILVSSLCAASIVAQMIAITVGSSIGAASMFSLTQAVILIALVGRYRSVLRCVVVAREETS